jgi:hypothetical protein
LTGDVAPDTSNCSVRVSALTMIRPALGSSGGRGGGGMCPLWIGPLPPVPGIMIGGFGVSCEGIVDRDAD